MYARKREAVASGRSVTASPARSRKVYISFWTMSVTSPMPRAKSSVRSKTGRRISSYPYASNTRRAVRSTRSHFAASAGRMS